MIRRKGRARQEKQIMKAEQVLDEAKSARVRQETLREREQESLGSRLARLAGDDSNHLGRMVLDALTEKYGRDQ